MRLCVSACAFLFGFGTIIGFAQIATQNNPHGKIKNACSDCHTTKGWSPLRLDIKFKHEDTGVALEGRHALTDCRSCHTNLLFAGAKSDCKSCHTDAHDGTLGIDCARCHTFQSWQDVSRVSTLHQTTRFPLIGRHQHVGCDDCHQVQNETQFINMPLNCFACHRQDYSATTNPNHQLAGFATNCEQCHGSAIESWASATFTHTPTFPLTLGHATAQCVDCHANQFKGTSTACFSCHQNDFQSAQKPSHVQARFPQDCTICHTTTAWQPSSFDHNQTRFQLTGAHQAVVCEDCHRNGQFAGTPMDCFSCHQTDFQQVSDPNHVTLTFSQDCTACHTMNAWTPATFDHDSQFFPIYSGAHRNKWQNCSACHVDPNNYKLFECITCHEHDQTRMDEIHRERQDYQYNSTACYNCHPDGRSD